MGDVFTAVTMPKSNVSLSESAGVYRLDATQSVYANTANGGMSGGHEWAISANVNDLDVAAGGDPISIVAGGNVTISGVEVDKSATTNSWDSSFYSAQSKNPNIEDFAVTWAVESTTGTIREMGGLDNDPTQNNSYSSLDYAIYQVNNYFYSRVYESGSAIIIPAYSTEYLTTNDRLGVKVVQGAVTYFILRGGVEIDIYTSTKKATAPLYFKGAMNRGSNQSGASSMGDVQWHTGSAVASKTVTINGGASDVVSDADKASLNTLGMIVQDGSRYSDIRYTRSDLGRFKNNGVLFPIDVVHGYTGPKGQSTFQQVF